MLKIALIMLFTMLLNLPFGYFRSRSKKYSFKWFLYVHLPVPLVVITRLASQTDYKFIPAFIIAAFVGQYCGGKAGV